MFEAIETPYRAPYDGEFSVAASPSTPPDDAPGNLKGLLKDFVRDLSKLQRLLNAQDEYSVLLIFQAMDAAGKDGTIRAVMSGVNPAGVQTFSFKRPSTLELDHDFLWRTTKRLPERGRIGVFNRSHYEEVLIVRVHPRILESQRLPYRTNTASFWAHRLESIADQERHLARNGTVILKFWLNISREEQRQRFLARLEDPDKNWKFEPADVVEREYWDDYMQAYEEAISATSRPWAPWYAIPADDKRFMRYEVARTIVENLRTLDLSYPTTGAKDQVVHDEMYARLISEQD